jgi:hypothetical protein
MTQWQQVAQAAISAGLLIPPEPPKPKESKVRFIVAPKIRPMLSSPAKRIAARICVRASCGKRAAYSERMQRYITLCPECARANAARTKIYEQSR